MKRNILHSGLPLLLAAFFAVGCGEDPEIPQFESRNLSQGVLVQLPGTEGHELRQMVKFAIGNDIYYSGFENNQYEMLYRISGSSEPEVMWRGTEISRSSIMIKDNLLVMDGYSIESDKVAEYRQQIEEKLAKEEELMAQIAALETQITALEAEEEANYERIQALRDERNKLDHADENYVSNYDKLTAEIDTLEAKNSALYDQRNQLASQQSDLEWELNNLKNNDLLYQLEETWNSVSHAMFDSYNNYCSYNGKGYFYAEVYNIDTWTTAMLEYDPSLKRVKIYECVKHDYDRLFSTTKGIFLSLGGNQLMQFSFSPEWNHIEGVPLDRYDSTYFGLLSQNDKLYSIADEDVDASQELILNVWDAPYAQSTSTLPVMLPKDYGVVSYGHSFSYYGNPPIFMANGKLYLFDVGSTVFYEINPSTGRAASLFASWETHAIETPLFVAGNSFYYLFQNQLYKLTF